MQKEIFEFLYKSMTYVFLHSFLKITLQRSCREKSSLWSLKQLWGSTKQFVAFADSTNTGKR
jgi:hypothetical protein